MGIFLRVVLLRAVVAFICLTLTSPVYHAMPNGVSTVLDTLRSRHFMVCDTLLSHHSTVYLTQKNVKKFISATPRCKINHEVSILRCTYLSYTAESPFHGVSYTAEQTFCRISTRIFGKKAKSSQGTSNETRRGYLMKKPTHKNLVTWSL